MPQYIAAAIRYSIALIATIFGVLSEVQIEQLASAVVTIATIGYGVWKTRQLEQKAAGVSE